MKYICWPQPRRCLNAPPTFTRWHAAGAGDRTACGYLIPVAVPVQVTEVVPPWREICSRCRREHSDGVTGQLSLLPTSAPPAPRAFSAANFRDRKRKEPGT